MNIIKKTTQIVRRSVRRRVLFVLWSYLSGQKCCIGWYNITYTYICRNKINNNDERTHFFWKIYLSHFMRKGCVWEVSWRLNRLQHIDPQFDYSSTSFLILLGCSTGGPEGPALCWEMVLTVSNLTDSNSLNSPWHRVISLFDDHLLPVSVAFAPNSTCPRSRLYLDIFDQMHLFLDWRLGWRSICYRRKDKFNAHCLGLAC